MCMLIDEVAVVTCSHLPHTKYYDVKCRDLVATQLTKNSALIPAELRLVTKNGRSLGVASIIVMYANALTSGHRALQCR